MNKSTLIGLILYGFLFSSMLGASTIISTFDADLDGWTTNPQGTIAFDAGGFLLETDASSGGNMHVSAPGKFLGDLTDADNFSVDIKSLATPITIRAAFATLTFSNSTAGSFISVDLGDPSTVWTHYATPLNAAAFGVNASAYSSVMSNVTSITLILESDKDLDTETVGMDNFTISGAGGAGSSVPEPSTLILAAGSLMLFGIARLLTAQRSQPESGSTGKGKAR
jgi:hypothetical protein